MPTVQPANDSARVWFEWHDRAVAEMTPKMGAQIAEANAQNVALVAQRTYDYHKSRGLGHDEAKTFADQWGQGKLDEFVNGFSPETKAVLEESKRRSEMRANGEIPGTIAGQGKVTGLDIEGAVDTFRQAFDPARGDPYRGILEGKAPQIEERNAAATTIRPTELGDAAMQGAVKVSGTGFNAEIDDQARKRQINNLNDLEATARGEGAGQQAALARMRLALQRSGQQASGMIQQARGYERRGLRRAELLRRGEAAVQAETQNQAQNAQERQTAQAQVGTQAGAIRTTDVDAESKRAEFTARRNELQANLDSARAANDQNAINDFTKKLADLQSEEKQFNATQRQDISKSNADRSVEVQSKNADLYQEDQRVKIDADKAKRDAAQGLLTEAQRQEQIRIAQQMQKRWEIEYRDARDDAARARAQDKVQFWAGLAAQFLGTVVPKPPGAAQGGLVDEPTLVAEGEHDELVIPVTGVTPALRKALAVESKPFQSPVPVAALLKAALSQQAPIEDERMPTDWGRVIAVLAPSNNRARKGA
jgi:hypothetical protein